MDLADALLSLALIGISVACHVWIAYTKAGPKALAYVKAWFDRPEGQAVLENYLINAANHRDANGKTLFDRMGAAGTASLIASAPIKAKPAIRSHS